MTALGTTVADESARAMRSQSERRRVVDIKGFGKPSPFKGDEEKFRIFAHKLTGFTSAVWPQARIVLQWAADELETFDDDDAEEEWTRSDRTERVQRTVACSPELMDVVEWRLGEGSQGDTIPKSQEDPRIC